MSVAIVRNSSIPRYPWTAIQIHNLSNFRHMHLQNVDTVWKSLHSLVKCLVNKYRPNMQFSITYLLILTRLWQDYKFRGTRKGVQTSGTNSPWRLYIVPQDLIFVGLKLLLITLLELIIFMTLLTPFIWKMYVPPIICTLHFCNIFMLTSHKINILTYLNFDIISNFISCSLLKSYFPIPSRRGKGKSRTFKVNSNQVPAKLDAAKVATTSSCVKYCGQLLPLHTTDSLLQFPYTKHPQFHSFGTAGMNYLIKQLLSFI